MCTSIYSFLLLVPACTALLALIIGSMTNSWIISSEENFPTDAQLNVSTDDVRLHSMLIPIPITRGLFIECLSYRNVTVLISKSYDFRDEFYHDESETVSDETCADDEWMCRTGVALRKPLTRCIDRRERCNRIVDCEDKSDETSCNEHIPLPLCPDGYTECPDGKSCYIQEENSCDGFPHCLDGFDELNCSDEKCRLNNRVFCPMENRCARRENSHHCDGIVDCQDQADESFCQNCYPQINVFLCDSKCFPAKYRCDDTVQCSDFRDELNCNQHSIESQEKRRIYHADQSCVEQRFNPLEVFPFNLQPFSPQTGSVSDSLMQHLIMMHYLKLAVIYGIFSGIFSVIIAIVCLLFKKCCNPRYRHLSIYFYGFWMFLAMILTTMALIIFVSIWLLKKNTVADPEKNLPFDAMVHQRNLSLRDIEFFGWSFWVTCGGVLCIVIGFFTSCLICRAISLSRAQDKEYEIMHMDHY